MDERLISTLRLLAFLAGSVVAAIAAMIVLLLISIFRDIGLPIRTALATDCCLRTICQGRYKTVFT
ncbi:MULTISPECIES: hypothetical protein [unclassified Brucella]|uniref:hypothetical protein n=1 Tax=unclassified Brucella TaxID=2632610 RepID=UPI0012AE1688|nr:MULTISPECIES: hypothetical protein [unclassified Brucella]MRN79350.1 hypothetical protein [Brucella sp. 10RB9210]